MSLRTDDFNSVPECRHFRLISPRRREVIVIPQKAKLSREKRSILTSLHRLNRVAFDRAGDVPRLSSRGKIHFSSQNRSTLITEASAGRSNEIKQLTRSSHYQLTLRSQRDRFQNEKHFRKKEKTSLDEGKKFFHVSEKKKKKTDSRQTFRPFVGKNVYENLWKNVDNFGENIIGIILKGKIYEKI